MATIKITEAQHKQIQKYLNEDEQGQNDSLITVDTNGETPEQTIEKLRNSGVNPNDKRLQLKIINTPQKQPQNSGRIISKANLIENRRKALREKSKVYSFGDFISK